MSENLHSYFVFLGVLLHFYAALGRKYGMDWRTVKKYHNGYEGRSDKRNKGSKLDEYRNEIKDKLAIKRITVQGVYQFMLKKYGVNRIG